MSFNYFHYTFHFFVRDNQCSRPRSKNFLLNSCIVTDAATVNPNGTRMYLTNGVNTCFIKVKPAVINGLRKLGNAPLEK